MKTVIKVTEITSKNGVIENNTVLIGVESIIRVRAGIFKRYEGEDLDCTIIESRHGMVCTTNVTESVEDIWSLINEQ